MMQKQADTIRFLAADMIQKANSGHPGAPMGLADIAVVLSSHLKHNPKDPTWLNRDRVVFSGGHATGLIYALNYLWGYDVELEDLKAFRQFESKTPGHPEYGHTKGIEITTGPLGQGVANAVGFAMAAKYTQNKLSKEIIDHTVYCLCGDGDLQEGISYEACSLAGHHKLDNLVMIYDSNAITIEGSTDISFTEDVNARFVAQGWEVLTVDGHDFKAIDEAFAQAKNATRPVLIIAKTTIAKGAATLEGSHHSHGAPLGDEEIANAKTKAGFDPSKTFHVDKDVLTQFRCHIEKGDLLQKEWNAKVDALDSATKTTYEALIAPDFDAIKWPTFDEAVATRDSNGKILNAIAQSVPSFLGGSADLAPSNKTELKELGDFPMGKNIHFGIREHAMAAIVNAMNLYGTLNVFSATFFVFSDYLKPSARIAALSNIQHFFVWTHDSIGVGEDGPTHQPIEHLSQFRALPNFYTFRPADGAENIACWQKALTLRTSPSAFVCSRQKLPKLPNAPLVGSIDKGGYLLVETPNAAVTLMASGSEVALALEVKDILTAKGTAVNVVSVPCFDLLIEQDEAYIDSIIDKDTTIVAIEAARGMEWYRFADTVINMDTFGASAPANELFNHFGFTAHTIANSIGLDKN